MSVSSVVLRSSVRSTAALRAVPAPFCALRLAGTAALAVVAVRVFGVSPGLFPAAYLAVVTVDLWAIDERESRLPNAIVVPGLLFTAWAVVARSFESGLIPGMPLLCGAAAAIVFGAGAIGGVVGWGDVKLSIVLAAVGGLAGRPDTVAMAAVLTLGLVAVQAIAAQSLAARIPFGPALLAGFWCVLAWRGG